MTPKKAIFFDLDNTIYSVSSIADRLFGDLFRLLEESGELNGSLDDVKKELMRIPYQKVAEEHGFSEELTRKGIDLLRHQVYEGPIAPFDDYEEVRRLPVAKFLVTAGFPKLQQSKIDGMNLALDFKEVHVVDVEKTSKKEVFEEIMHRNHFQPSEILVVGDDMDSEIKAAQELGMAAVLYDKLNLSDGSTPVPVITNYRQLSFYL
jgi:putative hydrolase of the HAD superfamily